MQEADVQEHIEMAELGMDHALEHLQKELVHVSAGKASPVMLDGLMVDYYGTPTPVKQVANISTADARSLVIQPWEKSMLSAIERAIFEANLGFTPMNDGEVVRINIPHMTEERRKDLVKKVKQYGEDAKVSVRSARHKAMDGIKKAVKDGYPEDAGKRREEEINNMTQKFYTKIDEIVKVKETDIMTV